MNLDGYIKVGSDSHEDIYYNKKKHTVIKFIKSGVQRGSWEKEKLAKSQIMFMN